MNIYTIWLIAFAAVIGILALIGLFVVLALAITGHEVVLHIGTEKKDDSNAGTSKTP